VCHEGRNKKILFNYKKINIMKRSFLLIGLALGTSFFMSPTKLKAQSCPNLDVSFGNFTNWKAYAGTCSSGGGISIQPSPVDPTRHAIMNVQLLTQTNQLYDEFCKTIPKVPHGFAYSIKLGNSAIGAQAEAVEYEMTIDSNNSLLMLHFAWVMDNPAGHPLLDQPRFTLTIKDSNGSVMSGVPCSFVEFCADINMGGLECVILGGGTANSDLLAKQWSTVGFSLEKFMGRKIRIYFETRDCTFSGHFGYAYVLAECKPMRIDLMFCDGDKVARLQAPAGFVFYKWISDKRPGTLSEGPKANQLVLQDPYPDETITCQMRSEIDPNCNAEVKVVIAKTIINSYFLYGIKNARGHVPIFDHPYNGSSWYDTCNRTATFVDLSNVYNSKKEKLEWDIFAPNNKNPIYTRADADSLFTFTFPDPDTPTTYKVRLKVDAENGCSDTSGKLGTYQYITIYPSPKVKIEGESEICEGESQWLRAKTIRSSFVKHEWNWVDPDGIPQARTGDSIEIFTRGRYILTSLDSAGCYAIDTFNVTVLRLRMNLELEDASCYGDASGIFEHGAVSGGVPPYFPFYWLFPNEGGGYDTMAASPHGYRFTNLKSGIYICQGKDAKDCLFHEEIEIKQSDSLQISGIPFSTTCGEDNGMLVLSATGGLPPYKFSITKEDGTPVALITGTNTADGLAAGKYIITVTDATDNNVIIDTTSTGIVKTIPKRYSCTTSEIIEVEATPIPRIEIDTVIWETCGDENGFIRVNDIDAYGFATYTWSYGTNYEDIIEENPFNTASKLKAGSYKADLVDGNGCKADTIIDVGSYPKPTVSFTTTPEMCHNPARSDGTISLTVNSLIPASVKYQWVGLKDTTPDLTDIKAGTYHVVIKDEYCKIDTIITVGHIPGPVADFEANSYNVANNTIFTLSDNSTYTVRIWSWSWDMDDGNTQTGKIVYYTYPKTGDYRVLLEVIDENGCVDTISKIIHIYEELNVFIPNMFTPNGDETNEKFGPKMSEYSKEGYQMSIFDRWGQRIFHTTNTEETWDGTVNGKEVAPNTVYAYRIIVRDFTGQEYEFVGSVTVLK
jgi:gliding motility-associated-like protein